MAEEVSMMQPFYRQRRGTPVACTLSTVLGATATTAAAILLQHSCTHPEGSRDWPVDPPATIADASLRKVPIPASQGKTELEDAAEAPEVISPTFVSSEPKVFLVFSSSRDNGNRGFKNGRRCAEM
jgi:hypothetical protein